MAPSLALAFFALLALASIACGGNDSATQSPRATEPPTPAKTPSLPSGVAEPTATTAQPEATPESAASSDRIQIDPENPRYFSWRGELALPIGATESGPETCETANGWLAISSGFDWQPDLENMLAHGGNFARIMPYFPNQPIQPWATAEDGRYDLSRINEAWVQRLEDYLAWTESHGVVVLLEVFDNWSFVNDREDAWTDNPWNPNNNLNYGTDEVSDHTERADAAIYRALTDNETEVLALLEQYVAALLDVALPHGNVIYNISNESNAPLAWSEHWAAFIRQYAAERELSVLIGEMPHTAEPNTGLESIAASASFDYVDAASQTSDDRFGKLEAAEVVGTDDVMTALLAETTKPITIGKVYHRSPATLWSKFTNGAAAVRYHRNCSRGGSDEDDPQRYFTYVQNLRTFVDEIDLSAATSTDDSLVESVTQGVRADVLAAPGLWYAVYLYRESGDAMSGTQFTLELGSVEYAARWFDPATGEWIATRGEVVDAAPTAKTLFTAPEFERNLVLLVQVSAS